MGKYSFYQDKEVKMYVRDYYNVYADTLEEAIEYVKKMGCPFEDDECKKGTKVEFDYRDSDYLSYQLSVDMGDIESYSIFSTDLEANDEWGEVVEVKN